MVVNELKQFLLIKYIADLGGGLLSDIIYIGQRPIVWWNIALP